MNKMLTQEASTITFFTKNPTNVHLIRQLKSIALQYV